MNTTLHISEIIENFRDDQDVMPSTRAQYYTVVRLLFKWMEVTGLDWKTITLANLIKYKDELFNNNCSDRTIRNYFVIIKKFFKWLNANGIYNNISEGIRIPVNKYEFRKKALTAQQAKQFLDSIDRETVIGKRDYALFVLLFTTGLRSISVEYANIGDIKKYSGVDVLWYRNKGSRKKDIFKPLTEKCLMALNDYLIERGSFQDHWPLFATHSTSRNGLRLTRRTMRAIFKKRIKQIGIEDEGLTLHSTRHTHGVLSTKAVGTYETQLSLAHASAQTTKIYDHEAEADIILKNRPGKAIDLII